MQDDRDEFEARGPSTRPVRLRGEDYEVSFAREALERMAEQVQVGYIKMNVEHLSYMPPVGRWHRAEVVDYADGNSELVMFGHSLSTQRATDTVLTRNPPEDVPPAPELIDGVEISLESRNFDAADWERLKNESPLRVEEQAAWSWLPPIIWLISVPVTWGVTQFVGGFLNRLGEASADGLVDWIKRNTQHAKESSRDALVEVSFDISPNLRVLAFVQFNAHTKDAVSELRSGLDGLGPVASFAGWMTTEQHPAEVRQVAFLHSDGEWQLCWWATEDSVFVTDWFGENYPEPERFLGRRLLSIPDQPGRDLFDSSEAAAADGEG